MVNFIKSLARETFILLHLDITKNIKYDRLTKKIIASELTPTSNCVDIGCHKGEILRDFITKAPKGHHYAFEPIPDFYKKLKITFADVDIFPYALGNKKGEATFNYVVNAPAYSGIKQRKYAISNPDIKVLNIEIEKLDNIIKDDQSIDFIKIDVEGGEYDVLLGAKEVLQKNKPKLLFEFGMGASDFYKTTPEQMYQYLDQFGYKIYSLEDYLKGKPGYTLENFSKTYSEETEYYFIAI